MQIFLIFELTLRWFISVQNFVVVGPLTTNIQERGRCPPPPQKKTNLNMSKNLVGLWLIHPPYSPGLPCEQTLSGTEGEGGSHYRYKENCG